MLFSKCYGLAYQGSRVLRPCQYACAHEKNVKRAKDVCPASDIVASSVAACACHACKGSCFQEALTASAFVGHCGRPATLVVAVGNPLKW